MKTEIFARKCSVTGEGINKGFVYRDGEKYFKNQEDLVKLLRVGLNVDENNELTDEFIINEAYNLGESYYTEWEDINDYQYILINGELKEIEINH